MPELNLTRIFVSRLNKLSIPYMITGAVASIIYGEPRLTNDNEIDFKVLEEQINIRMLVKEWKAAKEF